MNHELKEQIEAVLEKLYRLRNHPSEVSETECGRLLDESIATLLKVLGK